MMDKVPQPTPANENCGKKYGISSSFWRTRRWKWIFSKVPCKKSRLDAGATAALARRRLRPNPGVDADARQPEYRAHVRAGARQPSGLLPVTAGADASGRRH